MNKIARRRGDPGVALRVGLKSLDRARDDDKVLSIGVSVQRHPGGIVPFNTQQSVCSSAGAVKNSTVGPKNSVVRPVVGFFTRLKSFLS